MITTLAEAGKVLDIGRYAVWKALKKKRIRGEKNGGQWTFTLQDLEEYRMNKFDRKFSTYNGQPLYDKTKGEYSINEASKLLACPVQHLYYAARMKKIQTTKKKCAWVIHENDINEYRKVMRLGKKKIT